MTSQKDGAVTGDANKKNGEQSMLYGDQLIE